MAKDLDISDMIFNVDLSEKSSFSINKKNLLAKRTRLMYSSENAINYSISSRSKWAKLDYNTDLSLLKEYHHWDYEDWHRSAASPLNVMEKYGYKGKRTFAIPCLISEHYVGRFYLFLDEDVEYDNQRIQRIQKIFTDYQHYCLDDLPIHLNPLLDYRLISENEIKAIEIVSKGGSRSDIAQQCFLTERGVDYRLASIKKKLKVKTNSQLVHLAYKLRLI
ncbi:LuxR C-terminal-related transcriptional regulator [Shewanella sp. 10N.286.51.B8]|uniref:helix-turn-helix transcriptional regulator n=1 Tax=Shewanella sp. 10N.286.51.B8 TaxID=3229708 RepID=UPI003551CFB7